MSRISTIKPAANRTPARPIDGVERFDTATALPGKRSPALIALDLMYAYYDYYDAA